MRAALLTAALALAVLVAAPPRAEAGLLVPSASECPAVDTSRPFLPWLDPARYFLVPDGGFEDGASDWRLRDGAQVVPGNERFRVGGANDAKSLSLPRGSVARSPVVCAGLSEPTLRFFARNNGSPLSTLQVEVLFETAGGDTAALTIGRDLGGGAWHPTLPSVVVANLLPLLPDQQTPIAFRFTPRGGPWQIDDVYVDPWRKG